MPFEKHNAIVQQKQNKSEIATYIVAEKSLILWLE
jgi:hypothetical protein